MRRAVCSGTLRFYNSLIGSHFILIAADPTMCRQKRRKGVCLLGAGLLVIMIPLDVLPNWCCSDNRGCGPSGGFGVDDQVV
jgi:hypothetical protein